MLVYEDKTCQGLLERRDIGGGVGACRPSLVVFHPVNLRNIAGGVRRRSDGRGARRMRHVAHFAGPVL